jgi:hypothetical protein
MDGYAPSAADRFDEIIIDEGQDFRAAWADNLLRFLRPGGRAWWLEDPLQNLYGRGGPAGLGDPALRHQLPQPAGHPRHPPPAPARPVMAGSP